MKIIKKFYIYFFIIIFSVVWGLLFLKCRYGFCNIDESFYLTIPLRLINGDRLLCEEWHVSQLSSFILYPVVKIYMWLFHSTDGIFLHFRYIFTALWGMTALFIFIKLNRFSRTGSAIASLCFLIYTPFGIMALSYNTMGIMTLICSSLFLINSRKAERTQYVFSGIMFALSVLCCPYNAVIYIAFTVASLIVYIKKFKPLSLDIPKMWIYFSVGCFLTATVFLFFVLSKASFGQITALLPIILDDPEHAAMSFQDKFLIYFSSLMSTDNLLLPICLISAVTAFIAAKLKESLEYYSFLILSLLTAVLILTVFQKHFYLNQLMLPVNILGLYCCMMCKNIYAKLLFYLMFIPGLIYSFCLNYSSNQQLYAISSAMTVSAVAGITVIFIYARELQNSMADKSKKKYLCTTALLILSFSQLLPLGYLRYVLIFWDSYIQNQTYSVDFGAEKGLLISEEKMIKYRMYTYDVSSICNNKDHKNILFFSYETWLYFYNDFNNNIPAYSAWLSGTDRRAVERLEAYYKIFPEKFPDIIYADLNEGANLEDVLDICISENKNYHLERTPLNNYIVYIDNSSV